MFTVSFAFIVATALLFTFPRTRWMGVVGIFVLLCINPLLFSGLLLLAGAAYYFFFVRRTYHVIPNALPPPSGTKSGRNVVPVLLVLCLGAALALGYFQPYAEDLYSKLDVRTVPSEETIVLRTPGGLLEVSQIRKPERLEARFAHTLAGVEIGHTEPRIQVPAVYRYHIELAQEWKVLRTRGVFTVVAPAVKASLPVAFDWKTSKKEVSGSWLLLPFKRAGDLDKLERSITATLAERAQSAGYLEEQREDARATVREFVRTWLVEQTRWKGARYEDIRVLFADEPAGSIAPLPG
jgi:hypothetical protein